MKEFDWRRSKVSTLMDNRKLDVLLVYSYPLSGHIWSYTNFDTVTWLSNYDMLGDFAMVILPRRGRPTLLISEAWDLDRAKEKSWIRDVRATHDLWKDCKEILQEAGLLKARIGMTGEEFLYAHLYEEREKMFGNIKIESCTDIARDVLFPKSKKEMERYIKAAEIAEAGFQALLDAIRPNITDLDLQAATQVAMRRLGAEDAATLIGSGSRPTSMTSPTGRTIKEGDIIVMEPNPLYEGLFVEICRTVVVGRASETVKSRFDLLTKAFESAVSLIRPGLQVEALAIAQEDVIAAAGYWENLRPPNSRVRGHGEVGGREILVGNKTALAPGMVFTLHPNNYFPDTGYLALGEPFLVTENGYERLTKMPYKLYSTEREVRE